MDKTITGYVKENHLNLFGRWLLKRDLIRLRYIVDKYCNMELNNRGMCFVNRRYNYCLRRKRIEKMLFYFEPNYPTSLFWFPSGNKEPRIEWIDQQIMELKNRLKWEKH